MEFAMAAFKRRGGERSRVVWEANARVIVKKATLLLNGGGIEQNHSEKAALAKAGSNYQNLRFDLGSSIASQISISTLLQDWRYHPSLHFYYISDIQSASVMVLIESLHGCLHFNLMLQIEVESMILKRNRLSFRSLFQIPVGDILTAIYRNTIQESIHFNRKLFQRAIFQLRMRFSSSIWARRWNWRTS